MAYGELKVDSITFTDGVTDTTVSVSGLVKNPTFSGDITVTGTISGDVIQGDTLVSGAAVSGTVGEFGTITGNAAGFTTVTGTTVTGTTANFATLSGTTVTGGTGQFTSLTSTTSTITSGVFDDGTAAAPSIAFTGDLNTGIYSPGADQVAVATNGAARLYIASDGKVGVGTTSPVAKLQVDGTTTITGGPGNSTANGLHLYFASNIGVISGFNDGVDYRDVILEGKNLRFQISGSEKARIDSSGRLLVGTSSWTTGAIAAFVGNSTVPSGNGVVNIARGQSVLTLSNDDPIGGLYFSDNVGNTFAEIFSFIDATPGSGDYPGRLVFSVTADGSASPTERLRINNSGAIGLSGANFGTAGQVLVSNGSSAAPSWEQITPSAVFGWDHDNDTYGLYLPGTSIKVSDLTGTVDIDVQSRIRRCVINDSGVVQYYLDADDSDLKSGDWLRIVETEALDTAYTGTISESTNSLLRVGVPAWAAGTFTLGQRVTHNGSLWECIAATTTATPGAGTVASDLTGTDGQVMVEVPAFSVRYGFLNGVHTREVRLGCSDSLIAQGFQPHPAFIKTDGSYKDAFYIGAYHTYDDAGTGSSVSGQTNTRSQTRATFRTEAEARGTGWHVLSYLELAAIQTLLVCEFQDYNSQKVIGNGSDAGTTYGVTTGQSDGDGNHSVNSTDNVSDGDDYMAYRGIENLYGRAWQFVDGINVYERVVYLSNDQTAFADNTADGYEFYAQVPTGSSSYQKELHPLPDVFLPSVVTGASSTTYLGDAFWTSTGWRVAFVGGGSNTGARVGAFSLRLDFASGYSNSVVGSRLAYAAN